MHRYGRWAAAAIVVLGVAAGFIAWRAPHTDAPAAALPPAPATSAPSPADAMIARVSERLESGSDTELDAFSQLLARWQVDPDSMSVRDASRCPAVISPGVNCLRGRATLEQLARFDRPLILLLHEGEHQAHALLQGVGAARVRLDIGSERYELARASLSKFWNGEFVAIWRLPADLPAQSLKRGDAGAGVAWVKDRLATLDGGAASESGPAFFDAELEDRVRKLQAAYGIRADGIVGPETLFALSALDDSGPRLARTVQ
jgi:general secretion pathway protein A